MLLALAAHSALCLTAPAPGCASPPEVRHELAAERLDRCDPLGAYELLLDSLLAALPRGIASSRAGAEAEVDVLMLADLVDTLELEPELVERLRALRPWSATLPPHLRYRLDSLFALALRNSGGVEEARSSTRELGVYTGWRLLGPFDNERGAGMATPGPAEREIDLEAGVPGKEREVRWRTNPCPDEPLGRIQLHEMFRPSEQVYAYLATAIEAPAPMDIELRIGSTGGMRVLLNGRQLLAHSKERDLASDQDRVVLPLDAGWNQLLLKCGVEDGYWVVQTRFTTLAGQPLDLSQGSERAHGLRIDSARSATAEERSPRAAAEPRPEALEILTALDQDAQALRSLARYQLLAKREDRESRAAQAAALRAHELEPDHLGGEFLLARTLFPLGKSRAEMALDPYLKALAGVLQRDPDHLGALLASAAIAMDFKHLPERSDELTARALELAPNCQAALTARAAFLSSRDREQEGELSNERAEQTPEARALSVFALARARRADAHGDAAGARAELLASLERRPLLGSILNRFLAQLADERRIPELLDWTRRALEATPFAVDRLLESARLCEGAGLDDELRPGADPSEAGPGWSSAADLVARVLEICPEHRGAQRLAAELALRRGDRELALEALNEVLRLEPGADRVRRQIAYLSQGPEEERFEDPWRRDAQRLLDTPLLDDAQNHVIEVLERTLVYRVYANGGQSEYEHMVLRPLNLAGIEALDSWPIVYPLGGHLHVHAVNVHRRGGRSERVPTPRQRDYRRGDVGARIFDLPPLEVGDLVDVEYRVDETEPDVFGEYFGTRYLFYPDVIDSFAPTRYSELAVISPPELPIFATVQNGESLESTLEVDEAGRRVQRWIARDLGRPAMESDMPERSEISPMVDVSTYASWEDFGRWWWSFIQKEFDTSPSMEAKVRELTAGLSAEADKVSAIYRFVAQEIRYNAWAFGTHGYEPFSASTIFERRFGDCKDKSILLRQMLSLIGVDAVPVLIRANARQPEEALASALVEHFNHCIAYVTPTDERAGYYLDATADRNPIDYLRFDDQGARVLHVASDGVSLHVIPYAPPDENGLRRSWEIHLQADGRARVDLRDESLGKFGVGLRYRYGGETGDLAKKLGAELNQEFGEVAIESVSSSELNDTSAPVWLEAHFDARDLWVSQGESKSLVLGFDPIGLKASAVEPDEERGYEVVLERPYSVVTTVRYHLPEGAELTRLPPPIEVEADGLLKYSMSVEVEDGVVAVRRRFELESRRIPLESYSEFRRALQDIRRAEERTIGLSLPAAVEAPSGGQRKEDR